MPATIRKVDGYSVRTPGGVKAKRTSLRKAVAQKRLLQAVEHGWKPTGKKTRSRASIKAAKTMIAKARR